MDSQDFFTNYAKSSFGEARAISGRIDRHYRKKEIPQGDKQRILTIPSSRLRQIQRKIYTTLNSMVQFPYYVQGGVRGRSIISNANMHCKKKYVYTLDISNFFPSIHVTRISRALANRFPDFSEDLIQLLTRLTSYKYELPQGAPTSPFIANIVVKRFDSRIDSLCKKKRIIYTRYFDDIALSGDDAVEKMCLSGDIKKIIENEGYYCNDNKECFMPSTDIQHVTGLVVNDGLNITREFIESVEKDIIIDNIYIEKERQSLHGKIAFIKSINNEEGTRLLSKFRKLTH